MFYCAYLLKFELMSLSGLQLIGVPDKAEKDEIVKSVMELRDAEVEDGYTMEAIVSRKVGIFVFHPSFVTF